MARKVFFTFHFQRDIHRVNVVRNHWLTKPDRESAGYFDHSLWEESKKKGDAVLEKMINNGLVGTSVTAVLIGYETAGRKWVEYEISRSINEGKGVIGVYINGIKNLNSSTDLCGKNPLPSTYATYDWINDDGYNNFATWVEQAAKKANR